MGRLKPREGEKQAQVIRAAMEPRARPADTEAYSKVLTGQILELMRSMMPKTRPLFAGAKSGPETEFEEAE